MGLAEALNLKGEYGLDSSGEWSRVQIPPGPPPILKITINEY